MAHSESISASLLPLLLEVWAAQTSAVPRRETVLLRPGLFSVGEYPISPLCLWWPVRRLGMESQSAMSTTNRSTEQWHHVWTLKLQSLLPPPLRSFHPTSIMNRWWQRRWNYISGILPNGCVFILRPSACLFADDRLWMHENFCGSSPSCISKF